jgi:hypothetical protein
MVRRRRVAMPLALKQNRIKWNHGFRLMRASCSRS